MSQPFHSRVALPLVLAVSPFPVFAADGESVAPVVVTATRTAQTADESLASVSVISREDIERTQATSLPELLGSVQGLEFAQSGGRGTQSSLFIRGSNSDHVIVLIDGVRIGSATAGITAFETLPLANVERIEVVRGPRSSLYGSDAIGGVIQIFTRESDAPHGELTAGSHEYRRLSVGYGRQRENSGFSVDLSAEETDGFDAHENDPADPFFGSEPDDDGFESANLSLRGHHRLTTDVRVSANALIADSETEFDGTFQNRTEQRQTAMSARLDWGVAPSWQSSFMLGQSSDDSDNFLDDSEASHFDTTRTNFRWQNDVTLGSAQVLTAGVDFLRDEVDSDSSFSVTERETVGAFVQHGWTGMRWDTQASLRRDVFDEGFDDPSPGGDEFDDQTTGSLALGYQIDPAMRVFGSYGTAFRAPSFNDLFFPFSANPDLDPEQSETLEVGLRGSTGVARWEVTAYRTEIDDLIALDATFTPQNIEEARIQGIEVGVDATWDEWQGSLNADFKSPKDEQSGNQLPRRAKHNLRGSLTRSIGLWSVGADVTVRGERFDDADNTTRLDSHALIDLRANWNFAPDWRAGLKLNNVGNTDYELVDGFNTDDRNLLVQVDWRPGGSR